MSTEKDNKLKTLQATIDRLDKTYGKGTIMRLGDKQAIEVEVIPTGSLGLDIALGCNGLPKGRIIEIYGPESSGKTTLAIHAVAECQKRGGIAAIIDAEHAFDRFYAQNLGVDVSNLLISQPDNGEQALEIAENLIRSGAVDIVVVDSVAALVPRSEIEGEMGDSKMGLQARLMSQAMRKLTGAIGRTGCCCIFINQLREKIGVMFGNPETTTGGNALKFYASVRLDIRKSGAAMKDKDGNVVGMEQHVAAGWPTEVMAPFFMPKGEKDVPFDPFAINGANHWYAVGAHKVRAISNDLANKTFRPGWLRSVGPGFTNWALESFIDEAAHKLKVDPVAFRLKLLTAEGANAGTAPNSVGGALRQANVVKLAAEKAGWGGQLPAGTGLGLATSFGQERDMPTWVACVARVNVDKGSGAVKVEKLTLVADAGTIVDPDGALAQMQGASLWGLSLALHEGTEFEDGNVKARNLGAYTPLRIADTPELDITFVDSAEVPVGLGEPATTIVGPAIGNAIFNAVGARLRHIPITPAAVKAALA